MAIGVYFSPAAMSAGAIRRMHQAAAKRPGPMAARPLMPMPHSVSRTS